MSTLRHTTTAGQQASRGNVGALAVARTLLTRFAEGDLEAAVKLLADDVVVEAAGEGPLAGRYVGPAGWLSYAHALRESGGGTYHATEIEALPGAAYCALVMCGTIHGGTEREWSWRRHALYRVEDGLIREIWLRDLDAPTTGSARADAGAVP
jgi:ketosteroid isomerase-like protein